MLADEPDLEVVGEAQNGREALDLCRELRPDLALMKARMPKMDGLAATRAIKKEKASAEKFCEVFKNFFGIAPLVTLFVPFGRR